MFNLINSDIFGFYTLKVVNIQYSQKPYKIIHKPHRYHLYSFVLNRTHLGINFFLIFFPVDKGKNIHNFTKTLNFVTTRTTKFNRKFEKPDRIKLKFCFYGKEAGSRMNTGTRGDKRTNFKNQKITQNLTKSLLSIIFQ